MANERDEKEPARGFKVVDRRRFTDDGDERDTPDVPKTDPVRPEALKAAQAAAAPAPTEATSDVAEAPAAAAPAPAKAPEADGALNFSVFIQSLAQQCLMQLGQMPWPHGQRELAIEQARDTIDILDLLKAKTKGNLTPEEGQLMDSMVYELRMIYVEVQQALARQAMKRAAIPGVPPGMPPR
jgi:hypothetical protein